MAEKKQTTAEAKKNKCSPHSFIVTGWHERGGNRTATQMRCSKCLEFVNVEQLASKEWAEANL